MAMYLYKMLNVLQTCPYKFLHISKLKILEIYVLWFWIFWGISKHQNRVCVKTTLLFLCYFSILFFVCQWKMKGRHGGVNFSTMVIKKWTFFLGFLSLIWCMFFIFDRMVDVWCRWMEQWIHIGGLDRR
jgi:hypothetical protein